MTWEYIAGFFDGEGCVNVYPNGNTQRVAVTLTQGNPEVLEVIQEFLEDMGIPSAIYAKSSSRSQWFVLSITAREQVKLVLENLTPYLIVKQPAAIKTLEWMKANPKRQGGLNRLQWTKRQVKRMVELWEGGMTQERIALKFKTTQSQVSREIRRYQLQIAA